ncbi:hypothetical protein AK812_SmicGene44550 [Symbiodinium microadriaticum]|uniref:Uncharacterized protein n=1 Tax=Symbiodinium microadriaticum TaxID=2951 RepID=A0A1Q9BY92_SYMMI|nr:hypothetical protein AK812_SmicGene44550 [Symbiodinium microadriaticum]
MDSDGDSIAWSSLAGWARGLPEARGELCDPKRWGGKSALLSLLELAKQRKLVHNWDASFVELAAARADAKLAAEKADQATAQSAEGTGPTQEEKIHEARAVSAQQAEKNPQVDPEKREEAKRLAETLQLQELSAARGSDWLASGTSNQGLPRGNT